MQVVVPQPVLAEAVRTVARALPSRTTIPALSGVCLTAEADSLCFRATDLELSISHRISAGVLAAGSVVLPGRSLQELVRRLPEVPVRLESGPSGTTVRIGWEDSSALLHTFAPDQFPMGGDSGAAPPSPLIIDTAVLRRLLRETGFATGHDESRPWFTGVYLTLQNQCMAAMATDAAVVAYSEAAVQNAGNLSFSVILPARSLQELGHVLPDTGAATCTLQALSNQFRVDMGDTTLTTRLLEGQYPDFRRLLPPTYPSQVLMDRQRLLAGCERSALLAEQSAIRMDAAAGALTITARTPELGQISEIVPARLEGPGFGVPLNVRYVLEGLRSMSGPSVLLEFASARGAVRFREECGANSFFAVLPLLSF